MAPSIEERIAVALERLADAAEKTIAGRQESDKQADEAMKVIMNLLKQEQSKDPNYLPWSN